MDAQFYRLLDGLAPESILLVGPVPLCKAAYEARWLQIEFELQDLTEHFDLAIVGADFAFLEKPTAEMMLAGLRDQYAGTLWVLHRPFDECWQPIDFIALGLQQILSWHEDSIPYHLYGFSLQSYKPAPEWLNSDYWANPERFDARD